MTGSSVESRSTNNRLDARIIERCEAIPDRPAPGDYVVIDVIHFSNTVIELLANGAERVHVTDERGEELDYRESNPGALIGGSSTEEYDPEPGYDFFNSPSYVQRLELDGRPASMTSTNGGRAVATLRARGGDDVDVFVGSTMNAAALGEYLRGRDRPTYLVSSGSRGDLAMEDHVGATLISRRIDGVPVAETELAIFRRQVEQARGPDYVESNEIRRRDVLEYATDFDSRRVVPKLVGDSLVDVTRMSEPGAAEARAAD